MEHSAISWTDHTFNGWIGCEKISPGCRECYAEERDKRFADGAHWGPNGTRQATSATYWRQPLAWAARIRRDGTRRERVFAFSLGDWAEDRPELQPLRDQLFGLIWQTRDALDWLLLTKRPESAARMLPWVNGGDAARGTPGPWPNVWLGVTGEDQEHLLARWAVLRTIPAALRFLSLEPLLGAVDLSDVVGCGHADENGHCRACGCYLTADVDGVPDEHQCPPGFGPFADWVIAGCESGRRRRPAEFDWFRSIRDQCASAGVPFMLKQAVPWDEGHSSIVALGVGKGPGSRAKRDGVVELPYLDGRQHDAIPATRWR